jgi:hypothetical protein
MALNGSVVRLVVLDGARSVRAESGKARINRSSFRFMSPSLGS